MTQVAPVDEFRKHTWQKTMIPIGTAHDSLCWFFEFIEKNGGTEMRLQYREPLQTMIEHTAELIYDNLPVRARDANADDLLDSLDFDHDPAFLTPPVLPPSHNNGVDALCTSGDPGPVPNPQG